jgi:hypothetical protein
MNQILSAVRRGGGDEMVVTRLYTIEEKLYCDLRNPLNCDTFFKVPVVSNLGASIDAPSEPWHKTTIPWDDLPRVIVTYRSSQGQALITPIVTGVVKNNSNNVTPSANNTSGSGNAAPSNPVTGTTNTTSGGGTASTRRPANPGPRDASLATAKSKVIARETGEVDIITDNEFVVRTKTILLSAGVEATKSLAIASEIHDALQPLYDAVDELVKFAASFPTEASILLHPAVVAAGVTAPIIRTAATFEIVGTNPATGTPAPPISASFEFVPYNGPSAISNPPSEDYDSPNVQASPRD